VGGQLELDFKVQEQQRADVLRQAAALGIRPEVVTSRGQRFDDPDVARAVEAYERDMETLRPYFAVADELLDLFPAFGDAVAAVNAEPEGTVDRMLAERNGIYLAYQK